MSASGAAALGVSLGGISVSVGGNSGGGLGVNASVGGSNGINANASLGGGSGLGVNASVGGSTGINANVSAAPGSGLGVDASVGGSTGLNVGVSVGQDGITASVSGGSSSGSSGGSSSGSSSSGTTTYTAPDMHEVVEARQQICSITGNSAAYNGQVVFGSQGEPIGVIHAAWIKPDLEVDQLTFVTLASFLKPSQCVTITVKQVDVGRNGIRLPVAADALRSMIPVNRR